MQIYFLPFHTRPSTKKTMHENVTPVPTEDRISDLPDNVYATIFSKLGNNSRQMLKMTSKHFKNKVDEYKKSKQDTTNVLNVKQPIPVRYVNERMRYLLSDMTNNFKELTELQRILSRNRNTGQQRYQTEKIVRYFD